MDVVVCEHVRANLSKRNVPSVECVCVCVYVRECVHILRTPHSLWRTSRTTVTHTQQKTHIHAIMFARTRRLSYGRRRRRRRRAACAMNRNHTFKIDYHTLYNNA